MSNKQIPNSNRREFLSTAATGGVGLLSVARAGDVGYDAAGVCGKLLIAELLGQNVQRLDQLIGEVFTKLYHSVSITLDECKEKYEKLYNLMKKLEHELEVMSNSRSATPKTKELQELTQACLANLQLLRSPSNLESTEVARMLLVTKALDKQVCAQAAELLPPGEIELSEKATGYLRDILTLVMSEDFRKFHETVGKSNSYTREAEENIITMDKARTALRSAQDKMALVDNPLAQEYLNTLFKMGGHTSDKPAHGAQFPTKVLDKTALRREAVRDVRVAIGALKTFADLGILKNKPLSNLAPDLLAKLPDSFLASPPMTFEQTEVDQGLGADAETSLTLLDSLLLSLSGLIRVICASDARVCDSTGRPQTAALGRTENGVSFVPVGLLAGARPPFILRTEIEKSLGRHCGDTSQKNINACEANIRNVRTWTFGRRTGLKTLTWIDLQFGNIHCQQSHNFGALVSELAALI